MNPEDRYDETQEPESFVDDEPEEAAPLWTEQEVDRSAYVAILHDSFGERFVNYELLHSRAPVVTILRVLGAMDLEPKGEVQYFANGQEVNQHHQVSAGDEIYIVGKLAGGR